MIRRLAAVVATAAFLASCGAPKPTPAPAPEAPKAKASAAPGYKPARSATLNAVRKRGYVLCGVHPGLPGFALPDVRGQWRGFDVDTCRAVAAATLGDANKVRFVVIDAQDRFGPLARGEIDILSRNTSATFAREAALGVTFPVITY
jgi:general L-amino acid transport system substrate-binding protein